jgi:hypothetical protein
MRLQHPLCTMQNALSIDTPPGLGVVGRSSGVVRPMKDVNVWVGWRRDELTGGVSFICDKAVTPHINYSRKYLFMRTKHEFTRAPRRYFFECRRSSWCFFFTGV